MRNRSLILRQACSAILLAGALVAGSAGAQSTSSQIGNPKANTTSPTPSSSSSSSTTGSRSGSSTSGTTSSDASDMGTNSSDSSMSNGNYDSSSNSNRSSTSTDNPNGSTRSSSSATGTAAGTGASSSMNSTGRTRLSQSDSASSSTHHDKNKNKSSSQGGFTREDSSQTSSGTAPTARDPATKGAKNDSWATGSISNRTPTAAGTGDGDTSAVKPDAGTHKRDQSATGSDDRNHDGIPANKDDSSTSDTSSR